MFRASLAIFCSAHARTGTRPADCALPRPRANMQQADQRFEDAADDPAFMPAHRLIELFRAGSLSPLEVLRRQIARIERHGARLGAVTFRHFDEAMTAAGQSEQRYRDGTARPLEG